MQKLADTVASFSGKRVLVVGDVMLDEFIFGDTQRINPEAPVPVVLVNRKEFRLGGAANVANNLVALGAQVILVSQIGNDDSGKILVKLIEQAGISHTLVVRNDIPTIKKTRVLARSQQIVRFDEEETSALPEENIKKVSANLSTTNSDTVIISDYRKGFICAEIVNAVLSKGIPVFADIKSANTRLVKGVFAVVPNLREAVQIAGKGSPEEVALKISQMLDTNAVIKLGDKGAMLCAKNSKTPVYLPSKKRKVFDVTGAGDTFISAFALSHLAGASLEECAVLANETAGIAVEKIGTAVVSQKELFSSLQNKTQKIVSQEELFAIVSASKKEGFTIVFTNGCFDMLHAGHVRMLSEAKKFGDILVLGLNTDASVRKIKGENRPVNKEQERAEVLASLASVDYITVFDEDSPIGIINALRPDVFVKGNSLSEAGKKEADFVKSYGGQFILLGALSDSSTTHTIKKIKGNQP
ncbi:MAG: bifunctional heptose 7-phosphate kinase/heptose 1-phosphate adenyltransferase [Candidatus Woesearchaeota archaeon]|nr:bifunctional heptose 7-phosphate kinase/heptose 1-phosphate adenyltransferase [Candidatus Woesearchaeota archaeon]